MYGNFQKHLQDELASIEAAGLFKKERNIASQQFAEITLEDGSKALNFCANNYLGLSNNPRLIAAAQKAMADGETVRVQPEGETALRSGRVIRM